MLGTLALLFILKYTRIDLGLDYILACDKEDPMMLQDRDHGMLLRRLERERFQEPGVGRRYGDVQGVRWDDACDTGDDEDPPPAGSLPGLLEWAAGWLGEYAARCGM
jgi:hypothetical protein